MQVFDLLSSKGNASSECHKVPYKYLKGGVDDLSYEDCSKYLKFSNYKSSTHNVIFSSK